MSDDWRATVEEEICQSEHHATWQERTCLDDLPAAYQAPIVLDLALPGGLTPHLTAEGLGLPDPTPDEVVIAVHEYRIYLPLVLENQS